MYHAAVSEVGGHRGSPSFEMGSARGVRPARSAGSARASRRATNALLAAEPAYSPNCAAKRKHSDFIASAVARARIHRASLSTDKISRPITGVTAATTAAANAKALPSTELPAA